MTTEKGTVKIREGVEGERSAGGGINEIKAVKESLESIAHRVGGENESVERNHRGPYHSEGEESGSPLVNGALG